MAANATDDSGHENDETPLLERGLTRRE